MNTTDRALAAATPPDLLPPAAFTAAIAQTPVAAGPAALLAVLHRQFPEQSFREVARRGGWYRPGGVVDGRRRIADQLEDWLTSELATGDGTLDTLAERHADSDLRATRLAGTTLYLVADTGPEADAFLQLEIEILQESLGARVFGTPVDDDLAALVERCAAVAAGDALAEPRYAFRRLLDIGVAVAALRARAGVTPPTVRFIDDWQESSAHASTTLARHWIMQVSEHLDRFRQLQVHAKPLGTTMPAQHFADPHQRRNGPELHQALLAFDRQAGYPMAWFFNMVATHSVPTWVAVNVVEDAGEGFRYLPERDIAVVRNWLHRPYAP